jgi:miniconductance mechanosensitive channel
MMELLAPLLALFPPGPAQYAVVAALLVAACGVAYVLAKRVLLRGIEFVVKRSATRWDDVLLERGVFDRVAWLAPGLICYYAAYEFPSDAEAVVQRLVVAYMQVVAILVVTSLLSGVNDIYATTTRAKDLPIKGYIQIAKLLTTLVGGIVVFATVIDRSPWGLLSGIGAATAIVLLVFKDTILSFVASIQIASTGVIRIGDWVSMPQYGADGDVVDIALHRVTIQNWDKTLTAIPTHKFLDESFTNWRGMSESGGRRIKRAVGIDMTSVHFLEPDEVARLSKIQILKPYIDGKLTELSAWNQQHAIDDSVAVNGRRMTNLGTFRAYLVAYLKRHPKIHQEMTFLVRQLAPGAEGVPLEIYVFSNDTRWVEYEAVQSDIFDHIFAALPYFGLRVFQNPTGADFRGLRA